MLYASIYLASSLVMTPSPEPEPITLPALLRWHGIRRRDDVAVRHKRRGLWRTVTWAELADGVERAARGLAAHGFGAGDSLVIVGQVRAPALVALLAAQAAGGSAVLIDPGSRSLTADGGDPLCRLAAGDLRFVYAEDAVQAARLVTAPSLLIVGDRRGIAGDASVVDWDALLAAGDADRGRALDAPATDDHALVLTDGSGGPESFRHRDLLAPAETRLDILGITSRDTSAVVTPASWRPLAVALVAEWLSAGFALGLPEDDTTVATDVAALAPSYLVAPAGWYDQLWHDTERRLPAAGSWRRRVIDRALSPASTGTGGSAVGGLLVRAPLRRRLGLGAVRIAATSDGAVDGASAAFFTAIGVGVRAVPALDGAATHAHRDPLDADRDADLGRGTIGPAPVTAVRIAAGASIR